MPSLIDPSRPFKKLLGAMILMVALFPGLATPSQAQNGYSPFWSDQFQSKPKVKAQTPETPPLEQPRPYREPTQDRPRYDAGATAQNQPSAAQGWQNTQPVRPGPQPEYGGAGVDRAPLGELDRGVRSDNLGPVLSNDGAALPYDLWQGITVRQVEQLIAELTIPPRSTAVHDLWTRIITSKATPPNRGDSAVPFSAVQSEALFRSGLLEDAHRALSGTQTQGNPSALADALKARAAIAANHPQAGCPIAKTLIRRIGELPKSLTGTTSLMIGYCAVHDNNKAAAALAADLTEDNGLGGSVGVAALRAFSVGTQPNLKPNATMEIIDYRIVEKVGGAISREHLANAKPPLLAAVATSRATPLDVRIAAGEAALKLNAISLRDMTDIYRQAQAGPRDFESGPTPESGSNFGDETNRATLYNAAETEASPLRKARNIRSFLDSSRRAGLYWHGLRMMADPANQLSTLPEIGWFAETAIETSLASGDYTSARRWAAFAASQRQDGGPNLDHWLALIDIADPGPAKGRLANGLSLIENAARRGLFSPVLLHRLATVLDALDTQVPIPLWEMASRTPQPTSGHLPETGVLSALQNAAKHNHYGHMVLLTMKTLGPNGAEGAHMIALGDSIRALKRAGLKAEARQLGIEALFGGWPRAVSN